MNDKLEDYEEMFKEPFPLMLVRGLEDSEIIKLIDDCLESGKSYEPDFEEGVLY